MASLETRPFGFWTATALVVGGMIGAGIFVQPAQLAPYGWTGVAAWIVAIPGAMLLAALLAKLTAARPAAAGGIAIVGEALGPLTGLLVGWSYWVGVWSANALIALTAVRYAATFVPVLTATPLTAALAATALIWALTALNMGGAKGAGRFQVLTTVLKLAPLIAVVTILAALAATRSDVFSAHPHSPLRAADLTTALTLAFFPLVGFEAASLAAARVRDPARNVLRATLYGTALTGLLYVAISNGVAFTLPEATVAASPAPIALFVARFWGQDASLLVAAFASIAALGCLNGWVLIQGEIPLSMARSGHLPAIFGRTNRRDVPSAAILASSGLASALVLVGAVPGMPDILTFMLQLTTAATVWFYVGACAAAIALGVARPLAATGIGFSTWVLWGAGIQALAWSIALMLTAIPFYVLRPRAKLESKPSELDRKERTQARFSSD